MQKQLGRPAAVQLPPSAAAKALFVLFVIGFLSFSIFLVFGTSTCYACGRCMLILDALLRLARW